MLNRVWSAAEHAVVSIKLVMFTVNDKQGAGLFDRTRDFSLLDQLVLQALDLLVDHPQRLVHRFIRRQDGQNIVQVRVNSGLQSAGNAHGLVFFNQRAGTSGWSYSNAAAAEHSQRGRTGEQAVEYGQREKVGAVAAGER